MQWRKETRQELLDQAYKGSIPTGVFSIVAACLFLFGFQDQLAFSILIPWYITMISAQLFRMGFYFYRKRNPDKHSDMFWKRWLYITALPGSFLWGIFPLLAFTQIDQNARVIIAVFLATAPTAQMLNLAGVFSAWLSSMILLLLPMSASWMFFGTTGIALGLIGFIYAAYLYAVGRKFHRLMGDKIELTYRADASSRAKTTFLATTSHDLRQPLHALTMSLAAVKARLLSRPLNESNIKAAERAISTASASVDNLSHLLNSLLDVSKLEAGGVSPKISNIVLGNLFDHLEKTFKPKALEKGLEFKIVPTRLQVKSDPIYLQRIVSNLVSNAVQHTKTGCILIGCRRANGKIRIQVADTGPGIPPDKFCEIFEEFHQLDNPGRPRGSGQGLGLAIADKLARLLDHPLLVQSQTSKGSIFSVEVDESESASEIQKEGLETNSSRTKLVVLLHGGTDILEETAVQIRQWGYRVLAFQSCEEAQALQIRPHLIISGEQLKDKVSAIEAIQILRGFWQSNAPAIICLRQPETQNYIEAKENGCKLICDPPDPQEFRTLITNELAITS